MWASNLGSHTGKQNMGRWMWKMDEKTVVMKIQHSFETWPSPWQCVVNNMDDLMSTNFFDVELGFYHERHSFSSSFSSPQWWRPCKSSEPLHTQATGRDQVVVTTLDSHPKALSLTRYAIICFRPTSWMWAQRKFSLIMKHCLEDAM
jgi:hypothetical protein